jgi:Holliday junction resolvase RusA-like endonuclease
MLDKDAKLPAMSITFIVPGVPVPQPRPRFARRGKFTAAYTPGGHAIHAFRQAVTLAAKAAGVTVQDGPVHVVIDAVFVRPKSHARMKAPPALPVPDVDNVAKGVLDALKGIAWVDDKQVSRLVIEKSYGPKGRTAVRITCPQ